MIKPPKLLRHSQKHSNCTLWKRERQERYHITWKILECQVLNIQNKIIYWSKKTGNSTETHRQNQETL